MRHYHLFKLSGINIVPAAEDHVLFSVNDRKITVFVDDSDIAGMEPPVLECLGGRLGPFVIALHDVGAADDDLAALAGFDLFIVLVKAFHLDAVDRLADRPGF